MRIVFDPIIVNPDGISVQRYARYGAPLMFIDPKKLSAAGVREGVEYANPERARKELVDCGARDPDVVEDHMIGTYISQPMRQRYREEVVANALQPDFREHVETFLQKRLDYAREHPEEVMGKIKEDVDRPRKWHEQPDKPPRLEETKQGYRIKLQKAIDALPPHVKTSLEAEKVTVVCAEEIINFFPVKAAIALPDCNAIGVVYSYIHDHDVPTLTIAVKEEALHYLEQKMGVSKNEAYRKAASALLSDNNKMAKIDTLCAQAHQTTGKLRVRELSLNVQIEELFVEYFHVRDHLAARAGRNGEKKANAEVEKLFGPEIHAVCQQFEAELMAQAKEAGRRRG